MTLVPNHLQPLNGSKIFCLCLAILLLQSCFLFKDGNGSSSDTPTVVIDNQVDPKPIEPNDPDPNPSDSLVIPPDQPIEDQSSFNLSLLLPFDLDSLAFVQEFNDPYRNEFGGRKKNFEYPKDSKIALDFYLGFLFALDSVELTYDLNINVFDTREKHKSLNSLFADVRFQETDFVLGPIFNQASREVATYCKEKDIIQLLPLTAADNITSKNPSHIKANPTIARHVDALVGHVLDHNNESKILVLCQNTKQEMDLANDFESAINWLGQNLERKKPTPDISVEIIDTDAKERNNFEFDDYLSSEQQNVVIVASYDEGFVHTMTRKLYGELKDHDIKLIGLPTWIDSEVIRYDYLNALNAHISTNYYVDEENKAFKQFQKAFYEKHEVYPTKYAIIGYDLSKIVQDMLQQHGTYFEDNFIGAHYNGYHSDFIFQKNFIQEDDSVYFNYWENTYLNILKYDDFTLKKVN